MASKGPFVPKPFCDSVILCLLEEVVACWCTHRGGSSLGCGVCGSRMGQLEGLGGDVQWQTLA